MLKKILILSLVGLILLVMTGCNSDLTSGSVKEINLSDVESGDPKVDQDQEDIDESSEEFVEGGPTAEKQSIFKEVLERVNGSENPGRRNTPNKFISRDRDPVVYEAWVNESYDLGVAFRDRVFNETAVKYGKTAAEISAIYSEVAEWRADNVLTNDH